MRRCGPIKWLKDHFLEEGVLGIGGGGGGHLLTEKNTDLEEAEPFVWRRVVQKMNGLKCPCLK